MATNNIEGNMTKLITIVAFAASTALTACMSLPDQATQSAADYGSYPENYRALVTSYLQDTLKDPESARVEYLTVPQKDYRIVQHRQPVYGYALCLTVNAKNSFGGYTGKQLALVHIRNGSIVTFWRADGGSYDGAVKNACKRLVESGPADTQQ